MNAHDDKDNDDNDGSDRRIRRPTKGMRKEELRRLRPLAEWPGTMLIIVVPRKAPAQGSLSEAMTGPPSRYLS